jgi:hypothetical protein
MRPPHRRRDIKPDRIRALELLASCDNGCPEGILHAHGFAIRDMVELARRRPTLETTVLISARLANVMLSPAIGVACCRVRLGPCGLSRATTVGCSSEQAPILGMPFLGQLAE